MKQVALFGFPVAHSLSPAIHQAAFAARDLDWRYQAREVPPQDLAAAIEQLRQPHWAGANLTIPHKQSVLPWLDALEPSAVDTSAVNTIVNDRGRLVGHNTDLPGFLHDLDRQVRLRAGERAVVLGAGGAARAVAFGLAQRGLRLALIARSPDRLADLAQALRGAHAVPIEPLPWNSRSFSLAAHDCTLLVNTTPLGMHPDHRLGPWPDEVALPAAAFVYDLVYNPPETALVHRARQSGLQAATGGGMLVEQAALAFELWTGQAAPRERMQNALTRALEKSRRGQAQVVDA